MTVFPAMRDGKLQAVAVEAAGKGYGGDVAGFQLVLDAASGKLVGISVTTHKETPGLGSRIEDPSFTKQFKGKDATKAVLKKDGGDTMPFPALRSLPLEPPKRSSRPPVGMRPSRIRSRRRGSRLHPKE